MKQDFMRDPSRIKAFLAEIEKFWLEHPDWRFGQLVINVARNKIINTEIFNMEENKFLEKLDELKKLIKGD